MGEDTDPFLRIVWLCSLAETGGAVCAWWGIRHTRRWAIWAGAGLCLTGVIGWAVFVYHAV